jgi:uncharacterized protein (TIGR02246 family)
MTDDGISKTNRRFEAALADGNAAGIASLYTDDGRLMAPDAPIITGAEAIEGYWQAVLDMGAKSVALRRIELEKMGEIAVETGDATLVLQGEDGGVIEAAAKFIVVWKQQADGEWKLHNDCFNFDAPMG